MKNKKALLFILPLALFMGFIVILAGGLGRTTDVASNTATGRALPAFSLPLLSDPNRVMSNADLPKSPYLLNVWGSWCPTCRAEHPFLMQLHGQGVPMVGVNYKDEPENALSYLNEHKDPFLYSVQDYEGKLAMDLGLTGAPESFVIDNAGQVRLHIVGEVNEQNWAKQIKPCLDALAGTDESTKVKACGA